MASANPILGAISTDPLMMCRSAEIPFSSQKLLDGIGIGSGDAFAIELLNIGKINFFGNSK